MKIGYAHRNQSTVTSAPLNPVHVEMDQSPVACSLARPVGKEHLRLRSCYENDLVLVLQFDCLASAQLFERREWGCSKRCDNSGC